jgi:hypothetical protein
MPEQHDCSDLTVEWWERRHINQAPCLKGRPCAVEMRPSLFALIKTLVRSPSLAQLISHFRLNGPVPRSIWTTSQHTSLSNDERRVLESILPSDSYMSKDGWLRRLDNGCPHAFAALVLICIPGLRSLDLGPRFQDSFQILGPRTLIRTLQHLDVAAVGLARETVQMGSGRAPFRQAADFPQLLLLLHLIEIRSLTINLPRFTNPHLWSDIVCGALTTSLETLELAFTFLDEHDLACLLQVCPRLRDFKYDYWTTPAYRESREMYRIQYMPDRLSEKLVETQVLQNSLNIVRASLVTLHIHIVPPRGSANQNLRSIDFSQFESLTELHAPLQLLVAKDSPKSLADSLPASLRYLWLNDDATRLWLNHDYFMHPQDYDAEGQANPVDDPSWHPIYTDREVVAIISHFLSDWRAHVPRLQVLRLLVEHIHCGCWRPRDISYLRNALESAGRLADVHTTVTQVQRYDHIKRGQTPPCFSKERIKEMRCSICEYMATRVYEKGPDGELRLRLES